MTAATAELLPIEQPTPIPPPQRTAVALTSPASLLQMAVEKGADLATLERLMDLQDRHEANQARKAYVEAMTAFKSEPIEILKRKKVSFETSTGGSTSYSHAELSDITEAIGPAMAKHQLSYRWDIDQQGAAITVHCIVMHVLGHSEKVTMVAGADGSGKKNAIQQVASAVTYLQRYTLLAATGMSTKGMDDDGKTAGAEVTLLSADQVIALDDLIKEVKADKPKLLAYLKVASLSEIHANNYGAVQQVIEQKRKAAK